VAEVKVVGIVEAHKANKERGDSITIAERFALDVVSGKKDASAAERRMSVQYLLQLDLLRKKQRMASIARRKKEKKAKEQPVEEVPESQITPELAKRLASMEVK